MPSITSYRALLFGLISVGILACGKSEKPEPAVALKTAAILKKKPGDKITIAMLPKLINIDYFDACKRGATKAAQELNVTLIYDGPAEASGSEQNKFIDTWIRQDVDAICIAPNQ